MWQEKVLEVGERRKVTLDVWLEDGAEFSVENPTWELTVYPSETSKASGDCTFVQSGQKWELTAEIEVGQTGLYRLIFSFKLGSEYIRKSILVNVK